MNRRTYLASFTAAATAGCLGAVTDSSRYHPSSVEYEQLEVKFPRWVAKRSLRYYDRSSDSLEEYTPSRDWWMKTSFSVKNLGGRAVEIPARDNFEIEAGGETVEGDVTLPEVNWSDLRVGGRGETYWTKPRYQQGRLEAGQTARMSLVFDVPADEHPVLVWSTDSETHRLTANYTLPPE